MKTDICKRKADGRFAVWALARPESNFRWARQVDATFAPKWVQVEVVDNYGEALEVAHEWSRR